MRGPRASVAPWGSRVAPRPWTPLQLPGVIGWQAPALATSVTDGAAVTSLPLHGPNGTTPTLTGSGSVTWDAHTQDLSLASGGPVATLVLPAGTAGSVLGLATGGASSVDMYTACLFRQRNVSQFANAGARIGAVVTDDEQMMIQSFDGASGFVQFLGAGYGDLAPLDPFNDRTAKGSYHLAMAILAGGVKYIVVDGEIRDAVAGSVTAVGPWGFGGAFGGSAAHDVVTTAWGTGTLDPTAKQGARWLWERYIAAQFPSLAKNRGVVCLGDSQFAGFNDGGTSGFNTPPNNPPSLLISRGKLNKTWDLFGGGSGTLFSRTCTAGWTTTDLMSVDPSARTAPRYTQFGAWTVSGLRPVNAVMVWIGTNDLFGSAGTRLHDAPTTHNNIATICGAAKAAGAKVGVLTALKRTQSGTPTTYAADRDTLNTLIRANYTSYADAMVDVGNASLFPHLDNPDDSTYFENGVPGVHVNPTGAAEVADAMAVSLNGFV